MKVIFVHGGKASYPELSAYMRYFSHHSFEVQECVNLKEINYDPSSTVLWYLMGLYMLPSKAALVIHDYRSLSVSPLAKAKDFIKRGLNFKPDYRLFHDSKTRELLDFKDGVPSRLLLLGVDELAARYREKKERYTYDFCYVGDISYEREIGGYIEDFISIYGVDKSFVLIGRCDDKIKRRYSLYKNVIFKGFLSKEDMYRVITKTEFALSFVPNKYPYIHHVPSKLLEYAVMGKKIIANKSPSNFENVKDLDIAITYVDDGVFPRINELAQVRDNTDFDFDSIMWTKRIERSGVLAILRELPSMGGGV